MIIEIDLKEVYEDYVNLGKPTIMLVGVKPVNGVNGDFIIHDNLNNITKLSREMVTDKYCSGLQIINPHKINETTLKSNNFYDVWQQLINLSELKVSNITPKLWKCYDDYKNID